MVMRVIEKFWQRNDLKKGNILQGLVNFTENQQAIKHKFYFTSKTSRKSHPSNYSIHMVVHDSKNIYQYTSPGAHPHPCQSHACFQSSALHLLLHVEYFIKLNFLLAIFMSCFCHLRSGISPSLHQCLMTMSIERQKRLTQNIPMSSTRIYLNISFVVVRSDVNIEMS